MSYEVVVTCAVTGAGDTVGRHPGVPVTPEQIAGAAAMLADYAQVVGLRFPPPSGRTAGRLAQFLPHTATVSNPLDYTTPIWGMPEHVGPVFETMFEDPFDVAVIVQDYPLEGLDESKDSYLSDARSFVAATRAAGIPAAVCSTLPENVDRATREMLIAEGVAPMQGLRETLDAIVGAVWHGRRRERMRRDAPAGDTAVRDESRISVQVLDEHQAKSWLRRAGMPVPAGRVAGTRDAPRVAEDIGFPVAVKMLSDRLPHKTEAGAVALGVSSPADVEAAIARIRAGVHRYDAGAVSDRFLIERMMEPAVAKLLVGIRADPRFGLAMTLGSGGILTELVADAVTILLPADRADMEEALGRLRVSRQLNGFRGAARADRSVIVEALHRFAAHVCQEGGGLVEIEVNPLFVLPDRVCAVDALMRVRGK